MIRIGVLLMMMSSMMPGQAISQGERDRSMSYLHATRKQLLDAVSGMTEAQWKFKPGPERWSAAEITEHLAATEDAVWETVGKAMQAAAAPEKKAEVQGKDDLIMKAVPNRSRRVQAPEPVQPTGRWKSKAEAVAAFKQYRDRTIELVQTSQKDLRAHFAPHPFLGLFDCYQWTVFAAAHADRHLQQLREVMEDPGFPK
ncbi:MAG: DinB family protein [Acidimicrobiia bacterium]|nr:DinB family protein [Acidimicrobiia bacterium]